MHYKVWTITFLFVRFIVVFSSRPVIFDEEDKAITDFTMTNRQRWVYCIENVSGFLVRAGRSSSAVQPLFTWHFTHRSIVSLYWDNNHHENAIGYTYIVREHFLRRAAASIDIATLSKLYELGEANRIYVYVKDNSAKIRLIPRNGEFIRLEALIGEQLKVPCRPFHKSVKVNIVAVHKWMMGLGDTTYDARDGFTVTIKNATQSGRYKCYYEFEDINISHEFDIYVRPIAHSVSQYLTCDDGNVQYKWFANLGEDFHNDPDVHYQLLCQDDVAIVVMDASRPEAASKFDCVLVDLSIKKPSEMPKEIRRVIQTFENGNSYLDAIVNATNTTTVITANERFKNVSWSVTIDRSTCDELRFGWFSPDSKQIDRNNDSYTLMNHTISSKIVTQQLIVHQPLTMNVTGTYSLRILTLCPHCLAAYTFRLHFKQHPTVNVTQFPVSLLEPGFKTSFLCNVSSWPRSVIEWTWFECPPPNANSMRWPIVEECQKQPDDSVDIEGLSNEDIHNDLVQVSRLTLQPKRSGFVRCTANYVDKNSMRQVDKMATFYVADSMKGTDEVRSQRLDDAMVLACLVYNESVQMLDWQHNGRSLRTMTDESLEILNFMVGPYIKSMLRVAAMTAKRVGLYECIVEQNNVNRSVYTYEVFSIADTREWKWIIAGVAIAMLIFLWFSGLLIYVKGQQSGMHKAGITSFFDGDMNNYDAAAPSNEQAHLLPYDKSFEFPSDRLLISDCQLGAGAFGVVYRAQAQNILADSDETTVAVKMAKSGCSDDSIRTLIAELKIMTNIGTHVNVLQLLGAVTREIHRRQLFVITEFCALGNLQQFLRSNRADFVDQLNETADVIMVSQSMRSSFSGIPKNTTITTVDLMYWSMQAARAMVHLVSFGIIHGDLAARNCLLNGDRVLKIADFGLSRALCSEEDYQKTSNVKDVLPYKWMAIESLRYRRFSTSTDVWSFGVLLWEIFSLAEAPFAGVPNDQILVRLLAGHRMLRPQFGTVEAHELMRECWQEKPEFRPQFETIVNRLYAMLPPDVWLQCACVADGYERPDVRMRMDSNDYCENGEMELESLGMAPLVPSAKRCGVTSLSSCPYESNA